MRTGFGWIEIGGVRYDYDIVIHTDGSVTKRRKKDSKGLKEDYGHTPLSEFELGFLAKENADVVFVGTGQYGSLPITPGAGDLLASYAPVILPTGEILSLIRKEQRPYVAILHITC
jgi:hypothetical protein